MAPPDDDLARPVVLVHGYGTTSRSMRPLARAIAAAGRPVRAVALPDRNTGPLDAMVAALGAAVHDLLRDAHAERIDLVGHSRGGLVARAWAQLHGGEPFVGRLVTVASLNGGVQLTGRAADLVRRHVTPNLSELLVDGELVRALRAAAAGPAWRGRLHAVGTEGFDGIVLPPSAARIDGHPWHAMDHGRTLGPLSQFGHWRLLRDPVTHRLVVESLDLAT